MKKETVLITGSSKGLGRELALMFAGKGFDIILHGRDSGALESVKRAILKKGRGCEVVRGDLRTEEALDRLVRAAKIAGVSVLVNNAAQKCPHLPLEKLSDRQIDEILGTNLAAQIKLTRRLYAMFKKRRSGTIININSLSGLETQRLRSAYCAGKWGLRGFTDSFRIEAAEHNIRVIAVYPSTIKTGADMAYGMEPEWVAEEIYAAYMDRRCAELKLDNRPKHKRQDKKI